MLLLLLPPLLHHSGGLAGHPTQSSLVPVEHLLPLCPRLVVLLFDSQPMVVEGRTHSLTQEDRGFGQPTAVKGRRVEVGEVSGELEQQSRERQSEVREEGGVTVRLVGEFVPTKCAAI